MKVSAGSRDAGYASPAFLFALFLCSALALGAAAHSSAALRLAKQERDKTAAGKELEGLLMEVMGALRSDPSPETNGVDDPLWLWHGRRTKGYRIAIVPSSDRINLNFTRKNILEKTRLALLFRPGKNAEALQQFREDTGLHAGTEAFADFFEEGRAANYFSSYGWANINLIDEFAARQLGTALTGDPAQGAALRETARRLLTERRPADREALPRLLGASHAELWPVVNAEPLMNVNFVEPLILEELLAYPDYGIKRAGERCGELLARRETAGIGAEELRSLLGIDRSHPLAQQLGSITWFWEIAITAEHGGAPSLRAVACRLPPGAFPADPRPEYQLIERRFAYAAPTHF
jgi:hypothetical protein